VTQYLIGAAVKRWAFLTLSPKSGPNPNYNAIIELEIRLFESSKAVFSDHPNSVHYDGLWRCAAS
jgi:hypothetical protein